MRATAAYVGAKPGSAWTGKPLLAVVAGLLIFGFLFVQSGARAADPVPNEIVTENLQAGNPPSEWDVSGAGDPSIQGFATDISVDQGGTVNFKIDTVSTDYRIDIYRLGWYQGNGARLVDTIQPSVSLPQTQPACLGLGGTLPDNLVDCGNWGISASWSVPSDAVSGIYIARATREDVGGDLASHIAFVVRDDDGNSNLLVQTSDTTWQAYNQYGGYSLYGPGHAHKVSYNRPFTTRGTPTEDWLFNAEYPMVRWLERNGYDVSYFSEIDSDRRGAEILEHEAFFSVGHDEYWSAGQRANVEAARTAGVNLAFFSGNETYWKTRWEPSTADGGSTDYRTLVSYKEGDAQGSEHWDCAGNFNCDPDPDTWTGLWRQNQTGHDGGRPENALSGQISWGDDTTAIEVPASATGLRFWRNTGMSGATTLAADTLGYEFDWEQAAFASSYPPGRITLSDTTAGGKNHKLSLYRAPGGALVFGAGTVQWSWGLDGTHDRGSSTPDPRMQQATVNLLSDMGAQPETLQSGLTAGGAVDATAPTASITDPTEGATVPGGNVTISGTAADPGGLVAAVEVSTDGGLTWGRATGTTNWAYTFSASNGPVTAQARAVDDAANIGTATSVNFTVAAQTCPCTIFTPSTTGVQDNDTNSVELGVKFRSDVAGFITGIRFYKTTGNTGTHTGRLWTTGGVNLGTVTFAGESATGWQEATFSAPIAVDADTTYVATYHTTSGNYAIGTSFATAGVDNEPLHALQGGVDGPNGVYQYGGGGVYPTQTFGSSNYLVDVAFVNDVGPDTTPPTIVARSPSPGAPAVAVGSNVTATFSEPMAAASVSEATVELRDPSSAVVSATVSYSAATRTAILDPATPLDYSTTYTATVKGGAGGVTDAADPANPLVADVTWSFTTGEPPPPPPDEGPGGPILVVSSAANPFSRFYVEILRNEGLNAFNAVDITSVNASMLGDYDVVVLGEVSIDASQAAMFEAWVTAGGNLIAMRPDPDLAGLLGLTDAGTDLSDAYLLFDTSGGKPGAGLVGQTIQFHGTADRYVRDAGTDALATLYSDASTATANPAVTVRSVGSNGGQAAAFSYDLAKSVVYTRQGNPAWAGTERDGQQPPIIRSDDLFFPDWVDFSKIQIPQADEQQRLLANIIEHVNRDQMPLPRFWYFPRGEKAVVVMTGDDHASGGTVGQFDWDISVSPPGCNVADWGCVRGTSYMYPNTGITNSAAAAYEAQGFELGLHVNTNCANWTPATLADFYASQLASFASNFSSVPAPSTNRTHCITWSDWATQPHVERANGIRLDTNYYYWPGAWVLDRPGYFTGSGMPMRFADLDGSLIDVYQAATQMTDESGITYSTHINTLLDNAIGAPGYYGVVTTNMHTDNGNHPGQQTVVNAALARDVPVVSARQMLTWLDGRNGSSFEDLTWNAGTLTFSIARAAGSNGLQAMLPTQGATGSLQSLTRGGNSVSYSTQTIKGIEYAVFDAAAGSYAATFAADSTGPTISSVLAVPGAGGTATITWTTDEPATSHVDYGTDVNNLSSQVSDGTLKTSHSVDLTGLALETTYYFRVTSVDAVLNPTTEPNPPAAPATFSTPTAVATDTTVADFGAGTTGGSTYVSATANGEVILAPTVGAEFSGSSLPVGWESGAWTGGTASVGGGSVTVDGAWARTSATFAPGRALEFVATFSGATFQNAGLGQTLESGSESWAMFGMDGTANLLRVRVNNAGATSQFDLGSTYLNAPHRYRIEWAAAQIRFLVDGTLVHTANVSIGGNLRPIASDFNNGGGALVVDWMRLSPYASSGTFLSRIHDAGSQADWGTLSYVDDVPSGTTLALSVRRGDTPTPDGSWGPFSPVANGGDIGGSSRYLQYRVEATSSTGDITPTLSSVMLPFTASADTDPPGISGRTPSPGATDVAVGTNVTVTFDEPMNPATISTSSITLRAQGAGSDVPATVSYAGVIATLDPLADLEPATQYTVTVAASVADTAGNQLGAPDTWTFTTPVPLSYLVDTTAANFGAGTTGASSYVSETGNGEVILAPTVGAEFSGTSLPSGWSTNPWVGGGGAVVAGGSVTVDQAAIWTNTFYAPGRSLEFVANFSDPNQHIGFANDFNSGQWAIFSSGPNGDQLYARSNVPGGVDTPLGAGYLDGSHRFRIEWTATSARYFVDGVQVAFHTGLAFIGNLRPAASDFNASGSLAINWLRMSPYPAGGTFTSRVHDAGVAVDWRTLDGTATAPAGTGIAFEVRTGDTPTPDGSWTGFAAVVNGADIPGTSRYIQYRATLTTGDTGVTPSLDQVALGYVVPLDETAPTITTRSPAPNATGVAVGSSVGVTFSEAVDPDTVLGGGVSLRAQGAPTDVPSTLSVLGPSVTLDPTADLDPFTTYTVTVTTAVTDLAGNPLAAIATWSFTTGSITASFVDTTVADFGAGTTGGSTYVSATANGEVILAPTVGAEFSGSSLPVGWESGAWTGGTASVGGGSVTVDGAWARTSATFAPGRALEFVATFSGATFQNAGLGQTLESGSESWAMFGMDGSANLLRVRVNNAGATSQFDLGSTYLNAPHRYRIEWAAAQIRFLVDGTLVHTANVSIGGNLRPIASDFNNGGGALVVDWMRLSPYASSGTFESRPFDAGSTTDWTTLTTTTSVPPGTTATLETRTSSDTISWSAWAPVFGDAIGSPNARYLQYRVTLTTSDLAITPVVERVELTSVSLPPNREPTFDQDLLDRSNAENDLVTLDAGATDPDNDPLTYAASGLPPGLAIDEQSGLISGTIAFSANANSPYSVSVTVRDGPAVDATDSFQWTVSNTNREPTFDQDLGAQSSAENDLVSLDAGATDPDNDPLTYAASGLPPGLAINASTGEISGTIAFSANANSPYSVSVTVKDGPLVDATDSFQWTVSNTNREPTFDQDLLNRSNAENDLVTLDAGATDPDNDPLTYAASGLPPGLAINASTGEISGTIAFGAAGEYEVTLTVKDGPLVDDSDGFTWTISNTNREPTFDQDLLDRSNAENDSVTLDAGATDPDNDPLTYAASGLPPGLAIDEQSGLISGTIAFSANANSPYSVSVTVRDGPLVDATDSFQWTVSNTNREPTFDQDLGAQSSAENDLVSLDAGATDPDNDPLTYAASGLPPGLAINASTGEISGTIAFSANANSPYSVSVTVKDGPLVDATDSFQWTVSNTNREPTFDQDLLNRSNAENDLVTLDAGATDPDNDPLTYAASGLPPGLAINASTGEISGTIAFGAAGEYEVTLTVKDGPLVDDSDGFTWTISNTNREPTFDQDLGAQSNAENDSVTLDAGATDPDNDPLTYAASGLPPGLAIDEQSGLISGTIAFSANANSPYSVSVTVRDGPLVDATDSFQWTVSNTNREPTFDQDLGAQSSAENDLVTLDAGATDPDNDPLTYAASGLPPGLAINASTGEISGTIAFSANANSPYSVSVTVKDGPLVDATDSFQWTVSNTNREPTFDQDLLNRSSAENDLVTLDAGATDPDNDPLTYAASGLPPGLAIDASTGEISGRIDFSANANSPYSVSVTVKDGPLVDATDSFLWTVSNTTEVATLNVVKSSTTTSVTAVGQVVPYTFRVTNTGNVTLTGITVTDAKCTTPISAPTGDTNNDGKLQTTETWIYTCSHTVTQAELSAGGNLSNTVTVDSTESPAASSTKIIPIASVAALKVVKSSTTTSVTAAGQVVPYKFTITNTGNVNLNKLKVSDPKCNAAPAYQSGDTNNDTKLQTNETWVYTCSRTVTSPEFAAGGNLTNTVTVTSNQSPPASATLNIPITPPPPLSSLAGFVYVDADDDGVKDGGELPIAGVTVRLTGTNGQGSVNLTTVTDANGLYIFANLLAGTYAITETQPANYADGQDTIGTPGGTVGNDVFTNIVLGAGVHGINNNFGERVPQAGSSSLAGFVYVDTDDDGVRDAGELPIAGVTVRLTGTNGEGTVNLTTVTDANGLYLFANLLAGTYAITETQPANYADGKDTVGTPGGTVGNDAFTNIVLGAGVNGTNNNFGERTNQPPVASNDTYNVQKNTLLTIAAPGILGNDSDPNNNSLTAVLVTNVSTGTLTLSANGSFTYRPANGFTGTVVFTYRANDGIASSNVATVTISVRR